MFAQYHGGQILKLYLLSVYILPDVPHVFVNLLFLLLRLVELSVGFLQLRLFLL